MLRSHHLVFGGSKRLECSRGQSPKANVIEREIFKLCNVMEGKLVRRSHCHDSVHLHGGLLLCERSTATMYKRYTFVLFFTE
jgi:hypothetical protein